MKYHEQNIAFFGPSDCINMSDDLRHARASLKDKNVGIKPGLNQAADLLDIFTSGSDKI
jgi:hypothetical protein